MTALAEPKVLTPACQWGMSGWCTDGAHDKCAHRFGGPHEHGARVPSGYVTTRRGLCTVPPVAILPMHVWRCSCACHSDPSEIGRLF